jgi:tetrahydromethanopterin S-methyltransferase subunit G
MLINSYFQFDSCEFLVWDDELDDVVAANRHLGQQKICKNCESMKECGREFGKEFGREIGKEFGKKISHFVIVVSIMFVIFFAMLWKSM